jgi:hypothetical protein
MVMSKKLKYFGTKIEKAYLSLIAHGALLLFLRTGTIVARFHRIRKYC